MSWKQLLAYMTGSVDEELLRRNEYPVTENRILRQQITGHIRLTDAERKALAEFGKKLVQNQAIFFGITKWPAGAHPASA